MAADRAVSTKASGLENLNYTHIVLALSPTRLAFLSMKRGFLSNSPGELLAEIPRAEITTFNVGGGVMTAEVDITLVDGSEVAPETPKAHKGKTKSLAEAMGFRTSAGWAGAVSLGPVSSHARGDTPGGAEERGVRAGSPTARAYW